MKNNSTKHIQKTLLITHKNKVDLGVIDELKRKVLFDKIYILTEEICVNESDILKFKNISINKIILKTEIKQHIDKVFDQYKDYLILPYFQWDSNTKFSIYVYNKTYKINIDPKIFRQKDKMNGFLWDIAKKESMMLSYDKVQDIDYNWVVEKLWSDFIIKPTAWASSLLAFKVKNKDEFNDVKSKIKKKYKYILEKYINWNLYSIDFFFDWKEVFLLCLAREIPFTELLEKFSEKYLEKYHNCLSKEFLHFIPISYWLPLSKLTNTEINFIKKIWDRLKSINYIWFIHLEYKIKKKEKTIWFIEWGARLWGKRWKFIEWMHNIKAENIPNKLLIEKDSSRYKKVKWVNFIKYRNIERNFAFIKTNVFKKTNIVDILHKIPNFLNNSFEDHIKKYLLKNWNIAVDKMEINLTTSSDHFLYPFYDRSDTKLHYLLELDDDSYKKFLSKKHKILEKLVFHDY